MTGEDSGKSGTATARERPVGLRRVMADVEAFGATILGMPLRPYQAEVARAILASIDERQGRTLTVLMPRQSGKNQLSAHLEAYMLTRRQRVGGSLVKCAPTFRPQVLVSMARLLQALDNPLTIGTWHRRDGHVVELGRASIAFYSAEPGAHVVGGTASLLLECDEAQDVRPEKWERDFRPMGRPRTPRASSTVRPGPTTHCWRARSR